MSERVAVGDRSGAGIDYVFGYASLVAQQERIRVSGAEHAPLAGFLRGFRRNWGVAMNNWEGGEGKKHFVDPDTGVRPRVRVAYLDIYKAEGAAVNGLALPVDAKRLAELDAREVNYVRHDVTEAFESVGGDGGQATSPASTGPAGGRRVFTFVGAEAARERCQIGAAAGDVVVSRAYLELVRATFADLGVGALEEFDRTTDPLPFPLRELDVVD